MFRWNSPDFGHFESMKTLWLRSHRSTLLRWRINGNWVAAPSVTFWIFSCRVSNFCLFDTFQHGFFISIFFHGSDSPHGAPHLSPALTATLTWSDRRIGPSWVSVNVTRPRLIGLQLPCCLLTVTWWIQCRLGSRWAGLRTWRTSGSCRGASERWCGAAVAPCTIDPFQRPHCFAFEWSIVNGDLKKKVSLYLFGVDVGGRTSSNE